MNTEKGVTEGLVFGDFSALGSEERAKIDHALRDGSKAVELYWSFQENGLPVPGLPNGPSSLTPEEKERLEQQKLRDMETSLQNLQDFTDSAAASVAHYSTTELSLTPENNFVFGADTPPTGKESPRTVQQQVPEGAVQVGWESRSGVSFYDPRSVDLQRQTDRHGNSFDRNLAHLVEPNYVPQPQVASVQPLPAVSNQVHHGEHFQPELQAQPSGNQQSETVSAIVNSNKSLDGNGSSSSTSQTVERRRNRKKRPPNYYENLEKKNNLSDTNETTSPPELAAESGGCQQINNVNDVPPPVNMIPQQTLSQNVPMQNVPPEMMAQVIHANQQQYVQMFTNYLATASMDPQLAQQKHQQQQMAIATVNALIQQGMFPMQVPPPHMLPPMMGPGQVPLQPDTRIPPPSVEGQVVDAPQKYPAPMQQPGLLPHKRNSAEREFHQDQQKPVSDRVIVNNDKPTGQMKSSHEKEYIPHNSANNILQNYGHESRVRPSPPKQVLPPNNKDCKPSPIVPQTQPHLSMAEPAYSQDVPSNAGNSEVEAHKQLHESIEKVTSEFQALQNHEGIRKLVKPDQPEVVVRTESNVVCDKENTTEDGVIHSNPNQSDQFPSLPIAAQNRTVDNIDSQQAPEVPANSSDMSEVSKGEEVKSVLHESDVHSSDAKVKDTELTDNTSVSENISGDHTLESQQIEKQTEVLSKKNGTSQPQTSPNPPAASKPAGAWGSKPAGAWADLFKNTETAAKSVVIYTDSQQAALAEETKKSAEARDVKEWTPDKPVTAAEDKAAKPLGDLLLKYEVNHRPYPLQPRGLINRGNWCYVNATLQALLACPPFYHLMKALPNFPSFSRGPTSTPVIDSLIEFVAEFGPMQPRNDKTESKGKQSAKLSPKVIQAGTPFEPTGVYKMLHVMKYDAEFKHGQQEDAEEFLTCVLNGMHDEMVAAVNLVTGKAEETDVKANGDVQVSAEEEQEEEEQWEKVGPKNKSVITRSAKISESPITKIFGGQLRSILHQQGSKESATLEPFFTLQLDVHNPNVWDVKQALDSLVSKESLQGYTCSKTKVEVEATRRTLLEELPPVLILHLKWFIYNKSGGLQKHPKNFRFGERLELSKDLLSQNARSKYHGNQRIYKLFAVVNHHGARAIGGHYTTFVYHPGVHGWIHLDDSGVKSVNLSQVLKLNHPRVLYLLYYRRVDITP